MVSPLRRPTFALAAMMAGFYTFGGREDEQVKWAADVLDLQSQVITSSK